jgi:hypothetical protein
MWYFWSVRLLVILAALGLATPARAQEVQPGFEGLEPGPTPLDTYKLNALEIVSQEISSGYPCLFGCTSSWWRPVRGKFRYATRYDDFFRVLGRADLAAQHDQHALISGIFFWSGAAVFVAGGVLLFTGLREGGFPTRAKVGVGLMLGGLIENGIGGAIQPPVLSEADAVALASEYNRRLRLHLGLTDHSLALTLRGPW